MNDDVILANDCTLESPVGNKGQSNSTCETNNEANTTSRHNTDLIRRSSLKKKKRSNSHIELNEPQQYHLIQPYINPSNKKTLQQKKKRIQNRTFGDHITVKPKNTIRIASQNVNCIGISNYNNYKLEEAKSWLLQNEIDIVGWQEVGIAFHILPKYERLAERIKDIRWKKIRSITSNNKHESVNKTQYGGTAVMSFDEAAHRVKKTGSDPTGLGRWSWMLFEGKNNYTTRIISAYVPCKTMNDKHQTVYNQHKRYFLQQGIDTCPRLLMHQHITNQIKKWQLQGDNIVLLIDANEDLSRMGQLQTKLCYECNLVDPIRKIYSTSNSTLPPTSLTGSVPIDGIFVSPQIEHITRGGWLKIENSIGDHRTLYMDIPIDILLGEDPFHIHRSTARRLICDQPKIVSKYNKLLNQQLEKQKTFYNFNKLEIEIQNQTITDEQKEILLNKIDNSITNSIRYAEKRCRKLKFGAVPYTPELSKAGKTIHLWNNIIRKKKGQNISTRYLKRLAKKAGISKPMELSLEDCEKERNLASKQYRKLKKDAQISRELFIQNLASQQAALGNESTSNAILRINRNEELRESYKRIKMVTKPYFGATEKVLIPNQDENSEIVTTDKLQIEQALAKQNKKKFTDAYSSPFLQEPLLSEIGQDATSKKAQAILKGTYKPNSTISDDTKQFIKCLKRPKEITMNLNNSQCTDEDAYSYWKKKREKTNSSMSLRHIGTYKALTQNNLPTLRMINSISNMAFNLGIPLERWTHDLDVSLLKKTNKIRPSELRTIGTLEADFNQNAALHFSKRMMSTGIKSGLIPSSQYAKKGNRSIEAAIVKIMFFDYLRITKTNGAFLAMDLENCFDRMAHPISSLCSQRLGVKPQIAKCMIKTLCSMRHYMRTAYGDSEWFYSGTSSKPLQGAVQGNGAASPMFVAISCAIIAFLESQTVGVSIITAITLSLFTISAIMYVDDSDILISSIKTKETIQSIRNRAQKAALVYGIGVKQTGGAIRPEKCRWYLISYKWTNGMAKLEYNPRVEAIQIENSNGMHQEIKRLDVREGWKGLGIVVAPSGCWKDHMNYLIKEKILPWNESIKSTYLQRHDVYRAAFTSIFKSIDYTLPATSLSTSQCKDINAKLHKRFLPRIGIDTHMPLIFRYAPKKYQGLGSMNVEVKQFQEKVKIFLTHANTNSQLGQMIKVNLEYMHITIGVNTQIFSLPYSKYKMLCEDGWIQNLWEYTEKYNIKIEGSYIKPNDNRKHDYALMEKIIHDDLYTDEDVKSINRCRIYLRVQNLSEIANGNGNSISYCARNHIRNPDQITKYEWPYQPYPRKHDWDVWDDALQHTWSDGNYNIIPTLGEWHTKRSFNTNWKISTSTKLLYYKVSDQTYNVYEKKTSNRRNANQYQMIESTSNLPADVTNAIVNRINPFTPRLEVILPYEDLLPQTDITIQKEINIFMRQITFPTQNIEELIQDIIQGRAVAVTDASVSPITSIGASSFVITSGNLKSSCSGAHGVPNGSAPMDSYRAEIYGIYSILVCLQHLIQKYEIQNGEILIACDNKAGLFNSLAYTDKSSIKNGSFDILWAIYNIRQSISVKIRFQHVKGHQDTTGKPLTLLEKLNCIMDKRAGQYRKYIEETSLYRYSQIHKYSSWRCEINNQIITENIDSHIQNHIYHEQMKCFLIEKRQYTEDSFKSIDWIAIEKAAESMSTRRRIWLTKFVSGFCATGSVMKKRKLWDDELCPLCGCCKETTDHIIQCTDERSRLQYQKSIKKFITYLKKSHTDPTIISIFENATITAIPTRFKLRVPAYETDPDYAIAADEQDAIGWKNLFKGHISKKWAHLQMKHYSRMYSNPPSLHHWSKNVILRLYDIAYDMWDHRNNIVHDNFEETLNKKESDALRQNVIEEYNKGSQRILRSHRYLYKASLNTILERTVLEKKYWLMTVQASRICYQQQEQRNQNTSDIIREYAFVPD